MLEPLIHKGFRGIRVQGTATKDIPNCYSVTCLCTAVTEGRDGASRLYCEKASNINGLRDFLNFSGFLGSASAGEARTRLSSLEILL